MKTLSGILTGGEKVKTTGNSRDLGHGHQLEVIYSDESKGFVHWEDIEFDDSENCYKIASEFVGL
jgi:hypothetical protein